MNHAAKSRNSENQCTCTCARVFSRENSERRERKGTGGLHTTRTRLARAQLEQGAAQGGDGRGVVVCGGGDDDEGEVKVMVILMEEKVGEIGGCGGGHRGCRPEGHRWRGDRAIRGGRR